MYKFPNQKYFAQYIPKNLKERKVAYIANMYYFVLNILNISRRLMWKEIKNDILLFNKQSVSKKSLIFIQKQNVS